MNDLTPDEMKEAMQTWRPPEVVPRTPEKTIAADKLIEWLKQRYADHMSYAEHFQSMGSYLVSREWRDRAQETESICHAVVAMYEETNPT